MFHSKTKKERTRDHIFERKNYKENFFLVEMNIIIYYTHPIDYKNALSG